MKVDEKLTKNFFKLSEKSHIEIEQSLCASCDPKVCIWVCPAGLYSITEDGRTVVEYSGCLECGTCFIACPKGAIKWEHPVGGFGVQYRYG
ncbi:MAG: ferredoxin family protein [Deltaproteobacteria bacterium]|nr:MAG: ferredoxin family protein [Deltaproteobacteria bacterium]